MVHSYASFYFSTSINRLHFMQSSLNIESEGCGSPLEDISARVRELIKIDSLDAHNRTLLSLHICKCDL